MTNNNNDYTLDELEPPTWLNDEFFTELLLSLENDAELKIIEVKLSPASVKGDHYASVMFRAAIAYSCRKADLTKSFIIKTMPEQEGQKKEFLGDAHIFPTEIAMYTEVLPKFQAILRAAGDNTILSVPCVYHSLKPRQVMVFEDMIPQGYHVVRGRDANVDELKAALTKLAKWQAVSYKVLAEQPELLDKCRYDLTEIPNFLDQKFITGGLPNFIEMLGQVPSLSKYQRYFDVMRNTLLKSWATTLREYRENQRSGTYYVLCHGDFHLRNMMFKNNKSTDALEDCMLLDFQICNVGPMTNDLMYAIYMLFSADNRKHNRDELVYHFFDTFSKTLQSINYKGPMPKLAALRDQMFERKNNELFLMTTFLPAVICVRDNGNDVGELLESDELRRKMYYDEKYIAELEYALPRMLHLGYFE